MNEQEEQPILAVRRRGEMFVYSFEGWYQLKRIEVKGPYLTFYIGHREDKSSQKSYWALKDTVLPRLETMVDFYVSGDDLYHDEIHHSQQSHDEAHFHLKLNTKNMSKALGKIITLIQKNQHCKQRSKDYLQNLAVMISDAYQQGDDPLWKAWSKFESIDSVFETIIPKANTLSQEVIAKFKSYRETPSQERCQELMSMYFLGMFCQAQKAPTAQKSRIEKLIEPLKKISAKLNKPLNKKTRLEKMQDLLQQVQVSQLLKLENKNNNIINIDLGLQERIDFVTSFIEATLEARRHHILSFCSDYIYPWVKGITNLFLSKSALPTQTSDDKETLVELSPTMTYSYALRQRRIRQLSNNTENHSKPSKNRKL